MAEARSQGPSPPARRRPTESIYHARPCPVQAWAGAVRRAFKAGWKSMVGVRCSLTVEDMSARLSLSPVSATDDTSDEGLTPATSAPGRARRCPHPGLGSLQHLQQDSAHPPHLHRDSARACHICTRTRLGDAADRSSAEPPPYCNWRGHNSTASQSGYRQVGTDMREGTHCACGSFVPERASEAQPCGSVLVCFWGAAAVRGRWGWAWGEALQNPLGSRPSSACLCTTRATRRQ